MARQLSAKQLYSGSNPLRAFNSLFSSMKKFICIRVNNRRKGFTLLELIIVVIIIGILATLGFGQYMAAIEKIRGVEAREVLGMMRSLAIAYYQEQGTLYTMTNETFGIPNSYPGPEASDCRATHYYAYKIWARYFLNPGWLDLRAQRCTSGGKSPQAPEDPGITHGWQLNLRLDGSAGEGFQEF